MAVLHYGFQLYPTAAVVWICEGGGGTCVVPQQMARKEVCTGMCHCSSSHGPCVLGCGKQSWWQVTAVSEWPRKSLPLPHLSLTQPRGFLPSAADESLMPLCKQSWFPRKWEMKCIIYLAISWGVGDISGGGLWYFPWGRTGYGCGGEE